MEDKIGVPLPGNLLPFDGLVRYFGKVFSEHESAEYCQRLLHEIEWKNDEAVIFGKHYITKRKVAWYGSDQYVYSYSNTSRQALFWIELLLQLKRVTEDAVGETFNSCLLNLYHSGEEGMAWHSDDEKEMVAGASIASLSFGEGRNFHFRHKERGEKVSVYLEPGSLLVMQGETQKNWLHALPKTKKVKRPRVNLTFRKFAQH